MSKSSFEEQLDRHGSFTFRNTGVSMMPLLKQGRDLFTVRKKQDGERAAEYDVVLYRRGEQYVLHRVLELKEDGYIIRGDNCLFNEDVKENQVIGIMTGYVRKGKSFSTDSPEFAAYTKRMLMLSPVRIAYGRAKLKIKRTFKRMTGR